MRSSPPPAAHARHVRPGRARRAALALPALALPALALAALAASCSVAGDHGEGVFGYDPDNPYGTGGSSGSSSGSSSGGGSGGSGSVVVTSIDGATAPIAVAGAGIVINGSGFGAFQPGGISFVRFAQGPSSIDVAPDAASWTDGAVRVVVPDPSSGGAGFSTGTFTVQIFTTGGQSAAIPVRFVTRPLFTFAQISWTPTTSMPAPRRAHRAASIAKDATSGYIYVIGGNDGAQDLSSVISTTIDADGDLSADPLWTQQPALPEARAFHDVAVADTTCAPVSTTAAFLYVIGGQTTATAALASSVTIWTSEVDRASGALSAWTAAATDLPEPLLAARAVVANGRLVVTGGLRPAGTPSAKVYSAPIASDGSLGAFVASTAGSDLPLAVAFHDVVAFGGLLYVMRGDSGTVLDPFAATASLPSAQTIYAPYFQAQPGAWTNALPGTRTRSRQVSWLAFGQLLVAGGLANNLLAGGEAEWSRQTGGAGQVATWESLPTGASPNLFTFNGAAVRSPVGTPGGNPQVLILGGDLFGNPGNPSAGVLRTTLP